MQTYKARALGRKGEVTVLFSWTWYEERYMNHCCLVDGLVKQVWGEKHPSSRMWNGLEVLDISSTNIELLYPLTPLIKELL